MKGLMLMRGGGEVVRTGTTGRRQTRVDGKARYVMSVAVRLSGVGAARIRRYEAAGLVAPGRTGGGRRLFSDMDIAVIRDIAALENEGVNLKGIKVILAMRHQAG